MLWANQDTTVLVFDDLFFRFSSFPQSKAAVLPLSTLSELNPSGNSSLSHPEFDGSILFQNVFKGHLPASDYPKILVNGSLSDRLSIAIFLTVLLCLVISLFFDREHLVYHLLQI